MNEYLTGNLVSIMLLVLLLPGLYLQAHASEELIRTPVKAGSWYPGTAEELEHQLQRFHSEVATKPLLDRSHGKIRALIVPHAGYDYSGRTAAAGYRQLHDLQYKRVIVIGTAHHVDLQGLSVMHADAYATPLGRIPLDTEAIEHLQRSPLVSAHPYAHQNEHSIELQLPFLQAVLGDDWTLVPILAGAMNKTQFRHAGQLIAPLLDDDTLLVISGDFTHYGPNYDYLPFPLTAATAELIAELDTGIIEHIRNLDPDGLAGYRHKTALNDCAFPSVMVLLNLLPSHNTMSVIDYQTSGAMTGSYRNSVSYFAIAFQTPAAIAADARPVIMDQKKSDQVELSQESMELLYRLAVQSVRSSTNPNVSNQQKLDQLLAQTPEHLRYPSATFITLTHKDNLRGCIGSIMPRESLHTSIVNNARNATLHDYRFTPVDTTEVSNLTLEVSVLTNPVPIDSWQDFEVGRHGIILEKNGRKAVYLPEVAIEQGWDAQQTLNHLAMKAGLAADDWRDGAHFKVFTTQTYTRAISDALDE